MALTRAQLLMGDGGQGFVLPGQVQAVKEGNGITILSDGTIEVDSQTIQGVMRLGQTKVYADSAFNKYWWPLAVNGADVGKQLTVTGIDGSGNATLSWADSDGIDWTARGQIIAAIGAGEQNDTLVNIGSARSFLMSQVDNVGNPSGLAYSDVITSAMKVPAGDDSQRPLPAGSVPGEFRFNTDQDKLEVWSGTGWETVASEDPDVGGYVRQIKPAVVGETDVAVIPVGTTAEQITAPAPQEGFLRFNSDLGTMEFWDGAAWSAVAAAPSPGGFVPQTAPDGAAVIPAGPDGTRPTGAALAAGEFRYNTGSNELEYYNGTKWTSVAPSQGGVRSFVQSATPTAQNVGDLWYNTVSGAELVWNGVSWVAPGVTQTGPNASATIPAGTALQRGPVSEGSFRLNTDTDKPEMYIGGQWLTIPASASGAFVSQSVPTLPATGTPNAIIPAGSTTDRQTSPAVGDGEMRFNTTTSRPEMYIGGAWLSIPVSATGSFVSESIATTGTNSAVIPGGPNGTQQSAPAPAAGYLRYNSSEGQMEYYDGFSWILIGGSSTGSFVDKTVPTGPATATPNAVIPAGSTADRQTAPAVVDGEFRLNTTTDKPEMYINGSWQSIPVSATGAFVAQTIPTAPGTATPNAVIPAGSTGDRQTSPAPTLGEFRFNTTTNELEVWNGAWVTVPSSTSGSFVKQSIPTAPAGATPVAIIPSGTTLERQTAPAVVGGEIRFNIDTDLMEVFDGTTWTPIGAPPTAGLGISITGTIVKLQIPVASTPPAAGAAAAQAIDGSLYWDSTLGQLFIRYNDGTTTQWVAAAPAGGGGGSSTAATLAEAAAGTLNTVFSSPQTAVPKNASGMTGAAILPGGTTAQQPAGAADGWFRYNSTNKGLEFFDGTNWLPVVSSGGTAGGVNLNVATAAPANKSNGVALTDGDLYANTTTDQYFSRNTGAWVPFDQRNVKVQGANYQAFANDYVVVTTAGLTITLPATPIAGTVVTVVVAGTFLDTIVARNGSNIMSLAQDITLDKQYAAMQFTYTDATNGWRLN